MTMPPTLSRLRYFVLGKELRPFPPANLFLEGAVFPLDYILQFARILGFCLAGEALHHFLPLPVPASIYGLLLMFLALRSGLLKPERVKAASAFLIAVFPIMFIPGTVGVMDLWAELAELLIPMLLATFVITGIVFAVTGHVTQALGKRGKK